MNPLLEFIFIASVSEVLSFRNVMVLTFEGLRADYYQEDKLPKLWAYRSASAAPKYMESIFPSTKMVALHSLSTGVYPNKHGVYANELFDEQNEHLRKSFFDRNYYDFDKEIIPIWIENQRRGGKSGLMMWPGGEFSYQNIKANMYQKYDDTITWEQRADTMIEWMNSEKCNLVMAYFEDFQFYKKIFLDTYIKTYIEEVDNIIDHIVSTVHTYCDVVILSDHGVSQVPGSNVIKIDTVFRGDTHQKIVSGPIVFIKVPDPGERSKLLSTLENKKKYTAYTQENFKSEWFLERVAALSDVIILVAKPTYTFMDGDRLDLYLRNNGISRSGFMVLENGYDINEEDMNTLFVGIGPGFKKNKFPESFIKVIEVYSLLKALLELKEHASTVQNMITLKDEIKELLDDSIVNAYLQ